MSSVEFKYELGDLLKDKVTGFEGVVIVRAEYSTGCHHYGIQPQTLNAEQPIDWQWLDQSRLCLIRANVVEFKPNKVKPSGALPSGPHL